jgi:small subunit ribosomal protein S17
MAKKKAEEQETQAEEASIVEQVVETVADAAGAVADAVTTGAAAIADAVSGGTADNSKRRAGKRAEKIGVVASDKMTKTVVVRVDRVVKHPTYRKYIRKRKKFMAHDETGAKIGDKVRIVETRPLSARKRWRVVEIIQKAEL